MLRSSQPQLMQTAVVTCSVKRISCLVAQRSVGKHSCCCCKVVAKRCQNVNVMSRRIVLFTSEETGYYTLLLPHMSLSSLSSYAIEWLSFRRELECNTWVASQSTLAATAVAICDAKLTKIIWCMWLSTLEVCFACLGAGSFCGWLNVVLLWCSFVIVSFWTDSMES